MKYISTEGLKKIKEELKNCEITKRQEIAKRLEEAKELGDLSENAEYSSAKEAQAFNEGKIMELREIVKKSTLIKPTKRSQKKIQIGSIIEAKLINGRSEAKKQTFVIVGFHEADPAQGKISNESPIGQAFLEHQVGDIIEVDAPNGNIKYKIISIK